MMSDIINSHQYWEKRFKEKDWEKNFGKNQSAYFSELFIANAPKWLIEQINQNNMDVVDIGCAEGDGTNLLQDTFKGKIYGIDFSESAIENAKENYSDISFAVGDITNLTGKWDVVFLSNVLEHFKKPIEILNRVSELANHHIIIMIPFEENPCAEEHEVVFTYENIPTAISGFNLIYFKNIINFSEENSQYKGQQMLLVYSNDRNLSESLSIADSNNLIKRMEHSVDYNLYKDELLKTKIALSNELEVSKKLYLENQDLLAQLDNIKNELTQASENYHNHLQEMQYIYDDLYAYCYSIEHQLALINNSRTYQFFAKWIKTPLSLVYRVGHKLFRILKFLFTLNFKALKKELMSPYYKISIRVKSIFTLRKTFRKIAESVRGKRVIILPPTIDWHMPLFQRPQQLALAYSKKPNTIVIYMSKCMFYDSIPVAERQSETLWIVNEKFLDNLSTAIQTAGTKVVSLSWTQNKFYCERINPNKLIYEYIDELEIFHMYGPEMEKDHQELMAKADVTVCTATKLYNQAKGKAKNPIVSTNAGDYDFFVKTSSCEINPLISERIKPYKCVLGYYGAVAKWFDYDLVKQVASMHPEWAWVIVGIDYDKTLGKSGLDKFTNIIYIPPQPYKDLPSFLTAFDVATIPFLINEITLSTSPVKLFEYMAGGKPIITSRMPECLKYESVMLYSDAKEFCDHVERILALKEDDSYWDILKQDALLNTWDAKTDEILNALF